MCKYYEIHISEKWYKYQLEPITETKGANILWGLVI